MAALEWAKLSGPMDEFIGLVHGFWFFYFFNLISQGRQAIALKKVSLTVIFGPRQLVCSPQLSTLPASIKNIVVV